MGDFPFGGIPGFQLQAATPVAGFPLVNGTPSILTWTAPNDGRLHRVLPVITMDVTSPTTGGNITVNFFMPDGTMATLAWLTGSQSFDGYNFGVTNYGAFSVKAGTTVTIAQGTAVTAGTATLWAEIWGS